MPYVNDTLTKKLHALNTHMHNKTTRISIELRATLRMLVKGHHYDQQYE